MTDDLGNANPYRPDKERRRVDVYLRSLRRAAEIAGVTNEAWPDLVDRLLLGEAARLKVHAVGDSEAR